jgi:transposase
LQAQLDVQRTQLEALQAQLDVLQRTVVQLQAQLAAARKDSSTSSKPPSSDIVKPPKPPPPTGQDQRRIGGQPGHPKHERALFPPERLNGGSHDYFLELCPTCGHGLQPTAAAPRVVQQIEIHEVPLVLLYPLQPQPILQWRQDVTGTMVIEPSELAPFLPTRAALFLL